MLMVLLVLFPADDDEAKVSEKSTILDIGCFVKGASRSRHDAQHASWPSLRSWLSGRTCTSKGNVLFESLGGIHILKHFFAYWHLLRYTLGHHLG